MIRITSLAVAMAALSALAGHATAQEHSPVMGAWVVQSWENEGGTQEAHPGIFIFTSTHYSIMYTTDERPNYGDEQSDEETLAAYGSLIANAGRYTIEGDQLTTRAYVAKDPNYMGRWPDNATTYSFRIEDDMLFLDMGQWGKATLRKVEGRQMRQ